jgi:hypothetical protein
VYAIQSDCAENRMIAPETTNRITQLVMNNRFELLIVPPVVA